MQSYKKLNLIKPDMVQHMMQKDMVLNPARIVELFRCAKNIEFYIL